MNSIVFKLSLIITSSEKIDSPTKRLTQDCSEALERHSGVIQKAGIQDFGGALDPGFRRGDGGGEL